jgi:hypothetical protein
VHPGAAAEIAEAEAAEAAAAAVEQSMSDHASATKLSM